MKNTKTQSISIRLTDEELRKLTAAAEKIGIARATYARILLTKGEKEDEIQRI